MKIRTDFVTNSSSSSFTVSLELELKNGEGISFFGQGATGETGPTRYFRGPANISLDIEQLGESNSVDELVFYIVDGIRDGENPVFSEKSWFIKKLRSSISSVSDIYKVTMEVREENYFTAFFKYSYDMITGNYTLESGDCDPDYMDIDGEHGGSINIRRKKYIPLPSSDDYVFHDIQNVILRETSFESRAENIEKIHIGDVVSFKWNPDINDQNRMEVFSQNGSLGFLPSDISDKLKNCLDYGGWHFCGKIISVLPASARNVHAKSSIVVLTVIGKKAAKNSMHS